ncbi:MAG: response regulator [Planctomycetales bacterium]|nr:response regulator [Planctomycetales bacterium]
MSHEGVVFIVDDNEASASSIKVLLSSVGLQAETYGSAEEFLAAFDPSRKGCLVLDMRLPGMSGLELQAELEEQNIDLPIVFISGHVNQEESQRAKHARAVACLLKPFDGRQLCEIVRSVLVEC